MKIVDFISKMIQKYPKLFKDIDYEKSKFKVLNQVFFSSTDDFVIAKIKNPSESGYIVEPKYKKDKKTSKYNRIIDKPYGKEKYKLIPKEYFDNDVYYVYTNEIPLNTVYIKNKHKRDKVYFLYKKTNDEFMEPKLYKANNLRYFQPYPFSKESSIVCDIFYNNIFLQDDWMYELILLCKRTLEYFNDENQYKNDIFYPNQININKELKRVKDYFNQNGLNELQKDLGYIIKETLPDNNEIEIRLTNIWNNYRNDQIEFLNNFLQKYTN